MKYDDLSFTYNSISFSLCECPTLTEREIHSYHEILYYIGGDASLLTVQGQRSLCHGALLLIPKQVYHRFRFQASFVRLKIAIPDAFFDLLPYRTLFCTLTVLQAPPNEVLHLLGRICDVLTQGDDRAALHAYSLLGALLSELENATPHILPPLSTDSFLFAITAHIAQNLAGDLRVETLARAVNRSVSTVMHTVRRELGISLHAYVLQKRLTHAQELLLGGKKPSEIYLDCGFSEYSSFYRAYRRHFGYPPTQEKT